MQLKVIRSVSGCVCSFAAAFGILFAGSTASAGLTWNNGSDNWSWDVTSGALNWSGIAWSDGSDAVFGSTGIGAVTLGSNVNAASITFNNPGYTINPDASHLYGLTVGNGGITANASATIAAPVDMSAGYGNLVMNNSPGTLTVSNTVAFGGVDGSGNGQGYVIVHQGTVNVASGGALTNLSEIDLGDTPGKTGTLTMSGGAVTAPWVNNDYNGVSVGLTGGTGAMALTGNAVFDATPNAWTQSNVGQGVF